MPGNRILLVEDEPLISDLLAHNLIDEGYSVDVAVSAAEAEAFLTRTAYALVITDWRLPDGDGLVIADMAAQLGAATFVMSGYLLQMPAGRAARHEILMKPLRPSELLVAIERRIGKPWVS